MKTFVALDFEIASYRRDSACSIGMVRVEDNQVVQRVYFLIRPIKQRFYFSYIHGISWQDVASEPTFGELWPAISLLFNGVELIAAHNAPFDKSVLYACCDAHGIIRPKQSV